MTEETPLILPLPFEDSKWGPLEYRKRLFYRMLGTLPLISLPFSMAMPNLIEIQYDIVCRYLNIGSDVCTSSNAANQFVAKYNTVTLLLTTIPAVLMIPVVTAFVEKIGLVKGLMFVVFGYGGQLILAYPVAYWLPTEWSPFRLLILEMMAVFTAAAALPNFLLLTVNQLFPEPDLRPVYLGRMLGTAALTAFLGPALGSLLAQFISTGMFFALASAWYLVCTALFIYIVELPPIVSSQNSQNSFLQNWREQMHALKILSFGNVTPKLRIIAILITVWIGIFYNMDVGDLQVVVLYGKQYFNWHQGSIGMMMTIMAFAQLFCALVLFPLLQKFLMRYVSVKPNCVDSLDRLFMLASIMCNIVGLLFLSTSKSSTTFFIGLYILGHASLTECVAKPALLKLIPTDDSSTLITAISVLERVTAAIVPVTLMTIYEATLSWWPTFLFESQFVCNIMFFAIFSFVVY